MAVPLLFGEGPPLEAVAVRQPPMRAGCIVVEDDGEAATVMEERRREALVAFLWAGMTGTPDKGVIVERLADARRAVAMHQHRGLPPDRWLADEVRVRGIRENAAVLAALEVPAWRELAAELHRREHPDRVRVLDEFLAVLDRSPAEQQTGVWPTDPDSASTM